MPNFDMAVPAGPTGPPDRVVVRLARCAGPEDVEAACAALRAHLVARPARLVVCDVAALARSDLGTVDLICRLATTARACGCRLVLRAVPWHLRSLVVFAGLSDALPCLEDAPPESAFESEG